MARWGQRWGLDWATRQEVGTTVGKSVRVGGRYVPKARVRHEYRGIRMKSGYETNFAKFLDFMGLDWQYEPRRFVFEKILTGSRTYRPDFYVPSEQRWYETKGYMDRKSAKKIKRLRKYFPEIDLCVIDTPFFRDLCAKRVCQMIPGYVCRHTAP